MQAGNGYFACLGKIDTFYMHKSDYSVLLRLIFDVLVMDSVADHWGET